MSSAVMGSRVIVVAGAQAALDLAESIGYPLVAIPQASRLRKQRSLIMDSAAMEQYVVNSPVSDEYSVMLEHFLEYAIEVEADALCDGRTIYLPTVMEHIELAGVHSGDSAMVVPPYSTPPRHVETISAYVHKIALELKVKGVLNARFAVYNDTVYLLAVRPWACRTLPLVSKICDIPMAERAAEIMLGVTLDEMDLPRRLLPHYGIRSSVFPFDTFTETDPLLGPRMRSTGQAMALAEIFGMAYYASQEAAGAPLPRRGKVLITVTNADPILAVPASLTAREGVVLEIIDVGRVDENFFEPATDHWNDEDRDRDGFVLGEGAGIVILEELEHARARGAKIYAELVGYGATSDGYDMVAPSGEGAVRCMQLARSTTEAPIDYINTHGTSTPVGDTKELEAMREVFGDEVPRFASTKSLCGHSLGATGAQEAIHCLLMLEDDFIAPSINVDDPDPGVEGMPLVTETIENAGIRTAMTNSFGFGGTNATLILQKP